MSQKSISLGCSLPWSLWPPYRLCPGRTRPSRARRPSWWSTSGPSTWSSCTRTWGRWPARPWWPPSAPSSLSASSAGWRQSLEAESLRDLRRWQPGHPPGLRSTGALWHWPPHSHPVIHWQCSWHHRAGGCHTGGCRAWCRGPGCRPGCPRPPGGSCPRWPSQAWPGSALCWRGDAETWHHDVCLVASQYSFYVPGTEDSNSISTEPGRRHLCLHRGAAFILMEDPENPQVRKLLNVCQGMVGVSEHLLAHRQARPGKVWQAALSRGPVLWQEYWLNVSYRFVSETFRVFIII